MAGVDSGQNDGEQPGVESTGSLLGKSAIVGAGTLSSRVLGLVRDIVIAALVGASASADAFFVAFKLPNFLRRLFAEGAFAQAFVPVLAETRGQEGDGGVRRLIDPVTGVLGGVLLGLTVPVMAAAPIVAMIFAPGFARDPTKLALTSDLIRITFPYLMLISMTGLAGAILNSYGRFAVPAFTPVLLNLCLISAAVLVAPGMEEPAFALALGVLVAGASQLLFQVPALMTIGLLPRPRWDWRHPGVRRVMTLMVPALFGVSVSQINLLLDTVLASLLPSGSVAWLYYSDRLIELPLGVFAIAIATVILPTLSSLKTLEGEVSDTFAKTLEWAAASVLLLALPATAALMFLAEPILATLFNYGEFGVSDVESAAHSLRAYSIGLLAFMLVKVLAPGFYARQDMKTPVTIGIKAMVTNMILNPLLVFPLMWTLGLGHAGLALATSLAAWVNALLLYRGLSRQGLVGLSAPTRGLMIKAVLSVLAMLLVLIWLTPDKAIWYTHSATERALGMTGLVLSGLLTYIATLFLLGVRMKALRDPTAR